MDEFLVKVAFVAALVILTGLSWRLDAMDSTAHHAARRWTRKQLVRPWHSGHAATTLRVTRNAGATFMYYLLVCNWSEDVRS